jgi:DNA-3-methyladenine glycosylase I
VKTRCAWSEGDEQMLRYHDEEWGVPVHDDRLLFEFLILEGAQAGLSWKTILHKRNAYRKAFHAFDPCRIARYGPRDAQRLLNDPGIVRNRLKIQSAIKNAQAFLRIQKEFGSFDAYIWKFVGDHPIRHTIRNARSIPVSSKESNVMSADLKKRGFTFVGTTICYSFMQATGMVNDHERKCFRSTEDA